MTTERETLLPCPFCGADAEVLTIPEDHIDAGAMFVQCCDNRCMASSALLCPLMDDVRDLLVERWNRRAAQPAESVEPMSNEDAFTVWVSADSPPTEKQEYVHDLLVRNKYGNVDIGTYDGYAKYFEVGNSTRLGGWPVVEWMFLPQTIIEGSKP